MAGLEGEPGSDACAPARLDALFRDARCVDSTDATAAFLYRRWVCVSVSACVCMMCVRTLYDVLALYLQLADEGQCV